MLADPPANWAQIGWEEQSNGVRYTFIQWTTSPNHWLEKDNAPEPIGQSSYYTVLYENTPGNFTFKAPNEPDDIEPDSFMPMDAQIYGETHTLASQTPGGVYSGEVFSDMHIFVYGWANWNGGDNWDGRYFGHAEVSATQRNIWDTKCAF